MFLRLNRATAIPQGAPSIEKLEAAVGWNAYQEALNDLEATLATFPKEAGSIDEAPLR